jgi:translation elongation factor EF-G
MVEFLLNFFVENIQREYKVYVVVGKPQVNFRETFIQWVELVSLNKNKVVAKAITKGLLVILNLYRLYFHNL